ncbi:52 kDa repressor of the inhibitor of the protein kinase-like [Homalodisca vitripennis]|uniref:52 kDa repressor of the inhibitor of the protein kinase-like n=1 Tax=Homalodisca vitripennis TaxID=197043 RepID=UPI001EEB8022|nr:52 kDa repressor of the inhibitor of the protein kinase-like [Homalodisca vitripennis]
MGDKRKASIQNYFKPLKCHKNISASKELPTCAEQPEFVLEDVSGANVRTLQSDVSQNNLDIALFKTKKLTDSEKLKVLNDRWVPQSSFNFPYRTYGTQQRKFLFSWLNKYTWLSYSGIEDSAYCVHCMLFSKKEVGKSNAQHTGQLVEEGFSNWKKALEKFEKHAASQYHKDSCVSAANFKRVMDSEIKSIDKSLDKGKDLQAQNNVKRILPIIDTIILCGRQNIALRGHRDYGEFDINRRPAENEGNFRALLRARIEAGDQDLKKHFESCGKNATYISWNFQNQIIDACNQIITEKIATKVKEAKFFSILADETSDVSTIEQFSLCLRYVDSDASNNYQICEQFLKFMPLTSTTGRELAKTVIKGLEDSNIDVNNLRGQGYDGAAAMSGKFNGTQACIQEAHPTAIFVHCASHSLNLALSNASEVAPIRNCFGIVERVYNFFNTPKRQAVLQQCIASEINVETNRKKLLQLCPTRWVQRHDAVFVMKELLQPVEVALEEIKNWSDRDSSSGTLILLSSLRQGEFIISLLASDKLLGYTVNLSKKLQGSDLELSSAITHAETVLESLKSIRTNADEEFHSLFEEATHMANNFGCKISMPRTVGRQQNRNNTPADTPEVYYRRSIFIPWIESLISSLESRFMKHKDILKGFECLMPTADGSRGKEETSKLNYLQLCCFYKNDIIESGGNNESLLKAEFELWHNSFKTHTNTPRNVIDLLNLCDKDMFPNIHILLKILCTIPVTTSTAERSFSTLRRLKTYLRNTMGANRLSGLAALNIHREIEVTNTEVVSILKKSTRRLDFVL